MADSKSLLSAAEARVKEINKALSEYDDLVQERERLEAAIAALKGKSATPADDGIKRRKGRTFVSDERLLAAVGKGAKRGSDIARELTITPATVTNRMRKLEEQGRVKKTAAGWAKAA